MKTNVIFCIVVLLLSGTYFLHWIDRRNEKKQVSNEPAVVELTKSREMDINGVSRNQVETFKETFSHTGKEISSMSKNKIEKPLMDREDKMIKASDAPTTTTIEAGIGIPARFREDISDEDRYITPKDEFSYDVLDAGRIKLKFHHAPPEKVCRQNTKVVFLVESAVKNFALRMTIRQTWANITNQPVKVFFLLGMPSESVERYQQIILEESRKFGDIIQGSFIDSYLNLTVKSLMALKWTYEYCRETSILFIVDDDVYVNFDAVLSRLGNPRNGLLKCGFALWEKVKTRGDNRWAVPRSRYISQYYPAYCGGPCYIMSQDVVRTLYETSRRTRMDIAVEDVMITGILRTKSGIPLNPVVENDMCQHLISSDDIQLKMLRAWSSHRIS